ncbi:MAG: hypothetical protein MI974_31990 [Chitinophagales bacterium]|nr:hypothetical protein [Chitinophagales bacterium]
MNKGELAEKYVNELAYSSYLKYWCYPNPIDEEGDKKEICDLLILFRSTCIIISVKNYEFNGNYNRYKRKVVEKSTKQLHGAERKLFKLDRKIKIKHPERRVEEFNPENYDEIYRLTINAGEQFEYYSLADQREGKGFINIFNKRTFEHIINELDTIPDLIDFLRERERLLTENKEVYLEGQESDLLAVFMLNKRSFPEIYIGDHETLKLELEGAWEAYDKKNVHVKDRRAADKQSYLIDYLVKNDILKLEWGEKLAIELMQLRRTERRIIAQNLFELVEAHKNSEDTLARRHMPDDENSILFLFIYYPPEADLKFVDKMLYDAGLIYMCKTDFKYEKIIVLCSTKNYREYKFGLIYQEGEMSKETKDYVENLCDKYGWFQNIRKRRVEYKEFPNQKD